MVSTHVYMCVCVQKVSEWPMTMDNKTFNSLFHRLPCQRSGAANNQNYSVSECVQMCACARSEKSGNETQGISLQLSNRVITFCQQQMWDMKAKQLCIFGCLFIAALLSVQELNMEKEKTMPSRN